MTKEMTSHERFRRMYAHEEADRIPVVDGPWSATIERWLREGLPKDVPWEEYFGMDRSGYISVDNSPRYESKVLEETAEYRVFTTNWGATLKNWTHAASTPQFMGFTIVDEESWQQAKSRMKPSRDRVDWDYLRENYKTWRKNEYWIYAGLWFGFDVTHSWMVGTERLLMSLVERPEWAVDIINTCLTLDLQLLDMVWEEGYRFDCISWPDDLGYKHNQFMSLAMYRELIKPAHKRACDWARAHGVKVFLHSCGDVNPFVPEFIEIGVDVLNPLEVKAGMDPIALKKKYGKQLAFQGGINAVLWDKPDAIIAEMKRVIPVMKRHGGYIFSSDHSVPSSVSMKDFQRIITAAKELGRY